LPEILGMSDRILVMRDGRIVGGFDRRDATEERILECALRGAPVPSPDGHGARE
jgi:ABC-type sugar transport system ATPase subunit